MQQPLKPGVMPQIRSPSDSGRYNMSVIPWLFSYGASVDVEKSQLAAIRSEMVMFESSGKTRPRSRAGI